MGYHTISTKFKGTKVRRYLVFKKERFFIDVGYLIVVE
jgi:hypothetical protein